MTGTKRPSRWWIAAVPVAIALMLVASGYRVKTFWFDSGQHRELASADAGQWASATEDYSDAHGDTTRTYAVRLVGMGDATSTVTDNVGDEVTLRDGMVARTVDLEFEAEPDQALNGCTLTLIDEAGRTFELGGTTSRLTTSPYACVPQDTPGPSMAVLKSDVRGAIPDGTDPRPTRWTVSPRIVVPEDGRFVELRVSFEHPDYVTLALQN